MKKKSPLVDLPRSMNASLPSYGNSSSSSGVTTTHQLIEEKPDPMLVDKEEEEELEEELEELEEEEEEEELEEEMEEEKEKELLSDEDSFSYCPRPRLSPKSQEALIKYFKQVDESEGFDIIDFPKECVVHPIHSFFDGGCVVTVRPGNPHDEDVMYLAGLAIADYNNKNHTEYQVVEIVKVNEDDVGPYEIRYITFVAAPNGDKSLAKTFQAEVGYDSLEEEWNREIDIYLCRLEKKRGSGI